MGGEKDEAVDYKYIFICQLCIHKPDSIKSSRLDSTENLCLIIEILGDSYKLYYIIYIIYIYIYILYIYYIYILYIYIYIIYILYILIILLNLFKLLNLKLKLIKKKLKLN